MNVKNYYINDLYTIVEMFVKGLTLNDINYLIIKDKNYVEIHFLDNIYRFYGSSKSVTSDKFLKPLFEEGGINMKRNLEIERYASVKDLMFCAKDIDSSKKNKSGCKVLKKNDYKRRPNYKKKK